MTVGYVSALGRVLPVSSGQNLLNPGVTPNSPADKAGLHGSDREVKIEERQVRVGGDIIVAIDDQPVKSFDDLVTYLAQATEVNQTVTLTVLRQGKEESIKVTLAARPKPGVEEAQSEAEVSNKPRLGIEGVTVTPEIAGAINLPTGQQGALIERIEMGSPADLAQLNDSYKSARINGQSMPVGGDIITAVDGQPVKTIEDLQGALQPVEPGQTVTLTILRDGQPVEVPVAFSKES
jgi:2-alkenal reductase